MTPDEQREIDKAAEGLLLFKQRIAQYAIDLLAEENRENLTSAARDAMERIPRLCDYIDYLIVEIIDSEGGRGKALAITLLNTLLLDIEFFFRAAMNEAPIENAIIEEAKRRAEHMRSFIAKKSRSFYDGIVAEVLNDHVEAHGPWTERESKLATKLKPEIDRRSAEAGGAPLEVDTITRRLKPLIARTRH